MTLSPAARPHALIVDDDVQFCGVLRRLLSPHYRVTAVHTAESALDLVLDGNTYDVILCDLTLDGWSGADLYRRLYRRCDPHAARFVMLSGFDVRSDHPELAAELAERLLEKPVVDPAVLLGAMAAVCVERGGLKAPC